MDYRENNRDSSKQRKRFLWAWIIVSIFIVIILSVNGFLSRLNRDREGIRTKNLTTIPAKKDIVPPTKNDSSQNTVQQSPGSGFPVDDTIYTQIQGVMQHRSSEVIKESLRSFDVDGDGDQDIVGFFKTNGSSSGVGSISYILGIWYRANNWFVSSEYPNSDIDHFRLDEKKDGALPCSIHNLAIGSIVLSCGRTERRYLITIHYKTHRITTEYYPQAMTFHNEENWLKYTSNEGIEFYHPPDVQISEKAYKYSKDILVTTITAKRHGQILFVIASSLSYSSRYRISLVKHKQKSVFLRLSDGSYLVREWDDKKKQKMGGVFFHRLFIEGDPKAVKDAEEEKKITFGNTEYTIFSPLSSESKLREIDNILASIRYRKPSNNKKPKVLIDPQNQDNLVSLADIVTLYVPGHIRYRSPEEIPPQAIQKKTIEITLIDSPVFRSPTLDVTLFPFGSVGNILGSGGGKYYADKNTCYDYYFGTDDNAPQKIGKNQACEIFYGEGGLWLEGYYILDPRKRYILEVLMDCSEFYYWFDYEVPCVDVKTIAESVNWIFNEE